jgi:hypothetical protein
MTGMTDSLEVRMKILCDDPKLKLIWDSVIKQINLQVTNALGESFDLLSELSSGPHCTAARFCEVVFGEIPDEPSVLGCTSILTGVCVEEPDQANGTIVFSASRLRELSESAQKGVIAHELGHAFEMADTGDYFRDRAEQAADGYPLEWGFSNEIRQMYIEVDGSIPDWLT